MAERCADSEADVPPHALLSAWRCAATTVQDSTLILASSVVTGQRGALTRVLRDLEKESFEIRDIRIGSLTRDVAERAAALETAAQDAECDAAKFSGDLVGVLMEGPVCVVRVTRQSAVGGLALLAGRRDGREWAELEGDPDRVREPLRGACARASDGGPGILVPTGAADALAYRKLLGSSPEGVGRSLGGRTIITRAQGAEALAEVACVVAMPAFVAESGVAGAVSEAIKHKFAIRALRLADLTAAEAAEYGHPELAGGICLAMALEAPNALVRVRKAIEDGPGSSPRASGLGLGGRGRSQGAWRLEDGSAGAVYPKAVGESHAGLRYFFDRVDGAAVGLGH